MRFIKLNQVIELTGKSRSSIYSSISQGTFPRQLKISERSVVWNEAEIVEWMESCLQSRS